jgi:hypothetical protein
MSDKLIVSAAVYGPSGYAGLSRNLVLGLYKRGINIKLEPNMYEIHDVVEEPNLSILQSLEKTVFSNDIFPPKLCIGIAPWFDLKYKGYKVGYTMFEFNNLPSITGKYNWYNYCINMDEIWTPSNYNCKMFKNNGITNSYIMPVGIDTDKFKISKKNNEKVTFLSIGEFNYRKGWDILLSAFIDEFNGDDNVKLIIKSFEHDKMESTYKKRILNKIEELKNTKNNPPIIECITNILKPNELPNIYKNIDIFVMATLGEGFGLPMAEAMSCGIPCILPNNSGYLDFVKNYNGWLTKVNGYKRDENISKVSVSYFDSMIPDIDIGDLRRCMREAYENKEIRDRKAEKCRVSIDPYLEIENTLDKIYGRVINLPNISALKKISYQEGFDELEINNNIVSDLSEIGIRGLKLENISNSEDYAAKFVNNILEIKNEIEEEIESLDQDNLDLRRKLMNKRKAINNILRSN